MFKFLAIYSFIILNSFGYHCDNSQKTDLLSNNIDNLASYIEKPLKLLDCSNFKGAEQESQINDVLRSIVQNQTNSVINITNRHQMGEKLNACIPTKKSKALVLSFAGTSAFNPRSHHIMSTLIKCPEFQKLDTKFKQYIYSSLSEILADKKSKFTNWSGIDKGIMSQFLINPKVTDLAADFDFATFASEESEFISDPSKLSDSSISPLIKEVSLSLSNSPIGITNAIKCVKKYYKKAKKLAINPKLIITSHSSGGRSAVKFLEKIKGFKESDLTLTIDPVIEVQHAIEEVASQELGNINRSIFGEEERPVNVWSREQPKSLYKVNSAKWINFYQQSDSKGFDMSPSFGIQGSAVRDAENIFINDLSDRGHGEITYNEKVLDIMTTQINSLFN